MSPQTQNTSNTLNNDEDKKVLETSHNDLKNVNDLQNLNTEKKELDDKYIVFCDRPFFIESIFR